MAKYLFPKNFLWGSAFSGPQTEGMGTNLQGNKSQSNWDYWFSIEKYRFFNSQPCLNDFYHRYREDIKLAKELNFNSLRTSIQWTRLIPDGKNINSEGVVFYNNMINEMIKNNIKPIINLFHFDMPLWAQKLGGFLSQEVVDAFSFYAKTCFELFSDRVDMFSTFNEPIVSIEGTYWFDWHYPNEVNMKDGMQALWNMVVAHFKCVKEYRKLNLKGKIGCILNICPSIPRSKNPADVRAAYLHDLFKTKSFLDPMLKNEFPKELVALAKKDGYMWEINAEEEKLIADKNLSLDFLGINYYQPARIKSVDYKMDFENGAITPLYYYQPYEMPGRRVNPYRGWEIFPKGIYLALMDIKNNYNNIPVFISENGMGVENEQRFIKEGIINDQYRIDFLQEHLAWVNQAIKEGSSCFGYHWWSYIDSWSWMNSYKNRYGFIQLDLENNGERIKKQSAYYIADVVSKNELEYDEPLV